MTDYGTVPLRYVSDFAIFRIMTAVRVRYMIDNVQYRAMIQQGSVLRDFLDSIRERRQDPALSTVYRDGQILPLTTPFDQWYSSDVTYLLTTGEELQRQDTEENVANPDASDSNVDEEQTLPSNTLPGWERFLEFESRGDTSVDLADLRMTGPNSENLRFTHFGFGGMNWKLGDDSTFSFICSDNVCVVHPFFAEFLSPRIARIRRCDLCCESYTFQPSQSDLFTALTNIVSILRTGNTIHVDKSNFLNLFRLAHELQNQELFMALLEMVDIESMDLDDALLLLQAGIEIGLYFEEKFVKLRDMAASLFYQIRIDVLAGLTFDVIEALVTSPRLVLADEDSLYDIIRFKAHDNTMFAGLFSLVALEYVSMSRIADFVSFVKDRLDWEVNPQIWGGICHRLVHNPRHTKPAPSRYLPELLYKSSEPLNGIIAFLSQRCKGNVHDQGVVEITASGVFRNPFGMQYEPKNAADLDSRDHFCSTDLNGSWICYNFKDTPIVPSSYSIMSAGFPAGSNHPVSWVFEGSEDGSSWVTLDERNTSVLDRPLVIQNFSISGAPRIPFKSLRLRQTGWNSSGKNCLAISCLEIFGKMGRQ